MPRCPRPEVVSLLSPSIYGHNSISLWHHLIFFSFTGQDLPEPPAGTELKYIALGFGIQNYTCAEVGGAATATGALAMLYDITNLYPSKRWGSLSSDQFDALSAKALHSHQVPLNFDSSSEGRADPSFPGASKTNPFPADAPLKLDDMRPIPFLGHHFFDSKGVPTFTLANGAVNLPCKKLNAVPAPSAADAGPDGTGAVAWLYLGDAGGAIGAKYVYRVLTAGGNSHGCKAGTGGDSTSYAATYWFYN